MYNRSFTSVAAEVIDMLCILIGGKKAAELQFINVSLITDHFLCNSGYCHGKKSLPPQSPALQPETVKAGGISWLNNIHGKV